jgi:hypothetical protein
MIMENELVKYEVTIIEKDKCMCPRIDPVGQCTPTDCMICENALIKIIRINDGIIMRDDAQYGINVERDKMMRSIIYKAQNDPLWAFENIFNMKLLAFKKIIIKKILKEGRIKDDSNRKA